MNTQTFIIPQKDGHQTKLYPYYTKQTPPLASLVIFHGMAEHHDRYESLAQFFNTKGYDVYLFDHRGHGKDTPVEQLGHIADYKGHELLVTDGIRILQYVNDHNRCDKLVVIGHSMGSLIVRNIIQTYDTFHSVILCGTTAPNPILSNAGKLLALVNKKIKSPTYPSDFLNKLLFGGKNYKSLCTKTSFDWLTTDATKVGAYIHDSYCGFLCSSSFYYDLICLASHASKPSHIKKTRKDLPILLISGAKDPVSNYGKEVLQLHKMCLSLGFTNTTCKLYPDCRHELFNEQNHTQILTETHTWLQTTLTN